MNGIGAMLQGIEERFYRQSIQAMINHALSQVVKNIEKLRLHSAGHIVCVRRSHTPRTLENLLNVEPHMLLKQIPENPECLSQRAAQVIAQPDDVVLKINAYLLTLVVRSYLLPFVPCVSKRP